jgi:ubiquinone/menaquinone biosynthesis C-methylase UbiE
MVDKDLLDNTINQYNKVNVLLKESGIGFMNHGYSPSTKGILEEDFLFKNQISLYLNMFQDIETKNKKVLEVGCGRGGGIFAVSKYLNIKDLFACDINDMSIDYCKKSYGNAISFKVSDAHQLQYEDEEFDIVLSVESSHCYPVPRLFFTEVSRVLKNNGTFLYADCGLNIKSFIENSDLFTNIKKEDITENVRQACIEDYEKWNTYITDKEIKKKFTGIALSQSKEYSKDKDMYLKYVAQKNNINILGENYEQT